MLLVYYIVTVVTVNQSVCVCVCVCMCGPGHKQVPVVTCRVGQ